jgi:hypothetical protein
VSEPFEKHAPQNAVKVCSICQNLFTGHGNNAQPVNDGRCCDRCNAQVVIPARMRLAIGERGRK